MTGGLIQVTAYGDQDLYLTSNPEMTYFKTVYRRHTNFATEQLIQVLDKNLKQFGKTYSAIISRNGDLVQQMYLQVRLPKLVDNSYTYWTYGVGHAMLKRVEIDIGGQIIDRHYGDWMNIWTELTTPAGKRDGFDDMVGNSVTSAGQIGLKANQPYTLYVPLQFWFNRNPGLALPLIALQYHELKVIIELRSIQELFITGNGGAAVSPIPTDSTYTSDTRTIDSNYPDFDFNLYVNYIYLDIEERRRFVEMPQEYLIEQVQFVGEQYVPGSSDTKSSASSIFYKMNFAFPVKSLHWYHINETHNTNNYTYDANGCGNSWFNFAFTNIIANVAAAQPNDDTFLTAKIQLNSTDLFTERPAQYFRKVVPYEHFTTYPRTGQPNLEIAGKYGQHAQYIYSYSFAISPEDHQPCGTCNFTRVDNATLQIFYDKSKVSNADNRILKVYAVNYNILRIISGMAGLAFNC